MLKVAILLHELFLLICFASICKASYTCKKPYIELTVSPHGKYVQVNWDLEENNFHKGDWIGIYYGDTDTNNSALNLKFNHDVTATKGWVQSNLKFEEEITKDFGKPAILKYRAIYWRLNSERPLGHEAVVTTKICTYPNWMGYYWNKIAKQKLQDIFIPGSHHSVCDETLKDHNAMTQDQDILEQLLLGVRYLDIRVLYDHHKKEFWTGYGDIKVIELDKVIDHVIEFVSKTEKEIIIFDIQETVSGMGSLQYHIALVKHLEKKFERHGRKWWIPKKSWTTTLEEILNNPNKGKVIITYNNDQVLANNHDNVVWSSVKQDCGPLTNNLCSAAVGSHVTESLNKGSEKIAESIHNLFMTKDVGLKTNIMVTDYFLGMGTVRKALLWNQRKFQSGNDKWCDAKGEEYKDDYFQHNIIE